MQEWVRKHGFGDDKALLDYAYALSFIRLATSVKMVYQTVIHRKQM